MCNKIYVFKDIVEVVVLCLYPTNSNFDKFYPVLFSLKEKEKFETIWSLRKQEKFSLSASEISYFWIHSALFIICVAHGRLLVSL
jgi:hypothetical protein